MVKNYIPLLFWKTELFYSSSRFTSPTFRLKLNFVIIAHCCLRGPSFNTKASLGEEKKSAVFHKWCLCTQITGVRDVKDMGIQIGIRKLHF